MSWEGRLSGRQFEFLAASSQSRPRSMASLDDIEGLCTSLRNNGATARRKAMKEILEIAGKESNRVVLSAMGSG